jgi:ribonucleoside-diphosphate reductase beta chain
MPVDYHDKERSYQLFTDAKRQGTWDPDNIDFEQDKEDWSTLAEGEQQYIAAFLAAFYDGEENVTRTLKPYLEAPQELENPSFDPVQEEMFLTSHLYEEAKHTDFFSRYFGEVIGTQDTAAFQEESDEDDGYHTDDLYEVQRDLRAAIEAGDQDRLLHTYADAVLLYMGLIENQHARVAYAQLDQVFDRLEERSGQESFLPGLQEGFTRIRTDEGRHIMNGQWLMMKLADMDESIVTEVYEPVFEQYLEKRLPPELDPNPFDVDEEPLLQTARQSLESTVTWVGPERFDQLGNVERAFEESVGDTPATADD